MSTRKLSHGTQQATLCPETAFVHARMDPLCSVAEKATHLLHLLPRSSEKKSGYFLKRGGH